MPGTVLFLSAFPSGGDRVSLAMRGMTAFDVGRFRLAVGLLDVFHSQQKGIVCWLGPDTLKNYVPGKHLLLAPSWPELGLGGRGRAVP